LVAAVVEAAKAANPGMYLGRTAIQKLVYFVQVLKVPMQFRFRIHHYGPFCDELPGALEWLEADDVIVDESREPRYSNFAPGKNWPDLKQQFERELVLAQPTIQSVARALG